MAEDKKWETFCSRYWSMRLVRAPSEMPSDFPAALHRLSRGIVDIAVKLILFAQHRALAWEHERLDAALLEETYRIVFPLMYRFLIGLGDGNDPFLSYDEAEMRRTDPERNPDILNVVAGNTGSSAAVASVGRVPEPSVPAAAPAEKRQKGHHRAGRRDEGQLAELAAVIASGRRDGLSAHTSLKRAGVIWDLGKEAASA
jgi:hypothetical protein